MPWGNIYQGYNEARNYWTGRRSDAARAFSEFRSMHPNASYEDYRSFVEGIAGGNTFVRGGIPADKVLQSMAAENQRRQQHEQMQRQMEMLRYQAQTAGTIGALANQFSALYDNDAEVEDALVSALGGNDYARQQVRSLYKGGFGNIRERAKFAAIKDNLPLAIQMMEANPNVDLSSMFPDMPKSFLSGLSETAKTRYDENRRAKENQEFGALITAGKTAIDMGGQPAYDGYSEAVIRRARPQLDAYGQKITTETEARKKKERTEALKQMVDALKNDPGFVSMMTKPGFTPLSVLVERARQYGITDLSADEAAPYIQDLQEDSVAAKKQLLDTQRSSQLELARATMSEGQKHAVSSLTALLDEKGPLAAKAGPYAAASAYAIQSIGMEYDLTSNATRAALAKIVDAGYLESKGVDPADYAAVEEAILTDPGFRSVASSLSSSKAVRDASVEMSSALPTDLMTFDSWMSEFGATTAEEIKNIEEKTVIPLLQEKGDLSSVGKVEHLIGQLNQIKLRLGNFVQQAAKSADMWLIPGSGQFDAGAAEDLAVQRIYELQALIDRLNTHKSTLETQVQGQNNAKNEAAKAAADHAKRIQSDTWMGRTKARASELLLENHRQATPEVTDDDLTWPGDETPPAAPPSPWDDYFRQ